MKRILIIDDFAPARELIRNILKLEGHELFEAPDGVEGMLQFRKSPVDIVIVDINMPRKHGLQVIREIREDSSVTKIIAISGGGKETFDKVTLLAIAEEIGADEVIKKPFKPHEILAAVQKVSAE